MTYAIETAVRMKDTLLHSNKKWLRTFNIQRQTGRHVITFTEIPPHGPTQNFEFIFNVKKELDDAFEYTFGYKFKAGPTLIGTKGEASTSIVEYYAFIYYDIYELKSERTEMGVEYVPVSDTPRCTVLLNGRAGSVTILNNLRYIMDDDKLSRGNVVVERYGTGIMYISNNAKQNFRCQLRKFHEGASWEGPWPLKIS